MVKRLVAALATAGMVISLAAVLGSGGAQAAPQVPRAAAATSSFGWAACGDGFECGTIKVPLNYFSATSPKITLAVTRKVHTRSPYRGVMLTNPGGPGASGRGLPVLQDYVPGGYGENYDWVGFDPRGVGASTPALRCNPNYFGVDRPNFVPRTAALMRYWVTKTSKYAAQCAKSPARGLLAHLNTLNTVIDMEVIRATYAAENPGTGEKLNFYGFSYGTYLGQAYAVRYPSRVGRFVLDGVVDPTRYWYKSNLDQEILFDNNLNFFFKWVSRNAGVYHLGTDWRAIRRGFNAQLRKLDRHPAAGGRLGPNELTDAMLSAAYYVYGWDSIASAYALLVHTGRGGPLLNMYASANLGDDNGYAMYLATQCTDSYRPAWSTQVRDAWRIHAIKPFVAWDNTWFNAPCRFWPVRSKPRLRINGSAVTAKILMINETYDAATSFSGALTARGLFPSASLIEGYRGTTHSGSLSGVSCVDLRIAAYLNTGSVPTRLSGRRSDVRCPRVPAPPAGSGFRDGAKGGLPPAVRDQLLTAQRYFR